ncbi:hypothetical protein TIFTF001_027246 [Ficus carica]|uniref:Uncharacterized protein n=1 Tax=Ficus carica TaxID=3494 RepID=A0AA88IY63_FICCA|nr:hypothetical protein TIFTF001_027246 [Ficus carica]
MRPARLPWCSRPSGPRQRHGRASGARTRAPQPADRVCDKFWSFPKEETWPIRIVPTFERPRVTWRPINIPLKANFGRDSFSFIHAYSRRL